MLTWGDLPSGRKVTLAVKSGRDGRGQRANKVCLAIVPSPIRWEGLNIEERTSTLSSSRDEQGRQNDLDKDTAGQRREVKLPMAEQRVEQSPARDEGKASAELWERVWERQNLFAALERVERNGGAPGIDGMAVEELRPYLKEHWLEIREALYQQTYQPSPVRRVEIPKPDGGARQLGIPIWHSHCTSYNCVWES